MSSLFTALSLSTLVGPWIIPQVPSLAELQKQAESLGSVVSEILPSLPVYSTSQFSFPTQSHGNGVGPFSWITAQVESQRRWEKLVSLPFFELGLFQLYSKKPTSRPTIIRRIRPSSLHTSPSEPAGTAKKAEKAVSGMVEAPAKYSRGRGKAADDGWEQGVRGECA
ncbi:hypothetical protein D1P53_004796 [Cryptococcus gattii VGV]|nr:hypothetical protein D1P53_004796 [Cryptococcus gattii VGV]